LRFYTLRDVWAVVKVEPYGAMHVIKRKQRSFTLFAHAAVFRFMLRLYVNPVVPIPWHSLFVRMPFTKAQWLAHYCT
jgi:hypothetical protein